MSQVGSNERPTGHSSPPESATVSMHLAFYRTDLLIVHFEQLLQAERKTVFVTVENAGDIPLPSAVCFACSSMCPESDFLVKMSWLQSGLQWSSAPTGGLRRVCGRIF